MLQGLKTIFKKKELKVESSYKIEDQIAFEKIKQKNRSILKNIDNWATDDIYKNSLFKYGVPDYIKDLINMDIGSEETYTDLLIYYSRLFNKINYLELGVSVGKNFLQVAMQFENQALTGFDIEDINPILESKFEFSSQSLFSAPENSIRKENSYIKKYKANSNSINYLAGDIWDEKCWEKLSGQKFNFIFSDALHDPKALLWEYEMIEKYKLLDDKYCIFWDDLNHGLENSFYKIADSLKRKYNLNPKKNIRLIKINGWLGENEIKHDVGIISNILEL